MCKSGFAILILLLPFSASAEWRDPTTPGNRPAEPPAAASGQNTTFNLTGILTTENGRYATINGKMVKTGDLLDSATRVLKIMPHSVLIRHHDTKQTLYLVHSVKKPLK